jgi:hypothetical protein
VVRDVDVDVASASTSMVFGHIIQVAMCVSNVRVDAPVKLIQVQLGVRM